MDQPTAAPNERRVVGIGANFAMDISRPHFLEAWRLAETRLTEILTRDEFCDGAPFSWVYVSAGFGTGASAPRLGRIDPKYGDLYVSVGIDGIAHRNSSAEAVADVLVHDCLVALVRAADKYERPKAGLSAELLRLQAAGRSLAAEDEPEPEDELAIELVLADDKFGDPSELEHLHAIADAIDAALIARDEGSVEGTEVGGGSFLIFCVEGEPRAMLQIARKVLAGYKTLPGATAILTIDGEEQRVRL